MVIWENVRLEKVGLGWEGMKGKGGDDKVCWEYWRGRKGSEWEGKGLKGVPSRAGRI